MPGGLHILDIFIFNFSLVWYDISIIFFLKMQNSWPYQVHAVGL